jgi:ketose-bisphosphate aldolase
MPLEAIGKLTESARQGGYALGYFESWSIDSLQGVIDAAEEARAPIIIGFNGEFLCRPERRAPERLSWYAALGAAAAKTAKVPCGFIFNECPNDEWVQKAAMAGFNLVMLADPGASYEDYERRVTKLAAHAHRNGAAIEAEVGTLPSGVHGNLNSNNSMTDPETAARFVSATNIDLLAVSVGNVHIKLDGFEKLDIERLEQIQRRVKIPLVLHGGTGIAADSLREAIKRGVVKVNFGTYLKLRYISAIRTTLKDDVINPHELLGMGGEHDLMIVGRQAVREAVLERIEFLGCCGKA